ncbi:hypothetical protein IG631_17848 [Alternaria alternata]|nr:hypothetical protein IG631_17848 [Alternaria alternata]
MGTITGGWQSDRKLAKHLGRAEVSRIILAARPHAKEWTADLSHPRLSILFPRGADFVVASIVSLPYHGSTTSLTSTRQVYVHDSITHVLIAQYSTSTTVQIRGLGVPERCYQTSLDLSFSNYIGTGRMSFHGTRANGSIQGRRTRTLLSVIAGYDAF